MSPMNRAQTGPPPPVPGAQPGGSGGPPPVPNGMQQQQPRRPLSAQEMAERSRNAALESNQYRPPTTQPAVAQQPVARRPNPMQGARGALLAGIQNRNVKLKSAPQVERKPRNLKEVERKEEKPAEPEKVDATIFAILNRRQFMADDSDSESGSDWDSDSS